MRRFFHFLIGAAAVLALSQPATAQEHPGWLRSDIVDEATRLLEVIDLDSVQPERARQFPFDTDEAAACFSGPGEEAVTLSSELYGQIVLFGTPERTHTLLLYLPMGPSTNPSDALLLYEKLLTFLLPAWPDAGTWARDSLAESWSQVGLAMVDPTIPINDTVARHKEGRVSLATTGVPPDFIYYRVTTRPQCEIVPEIMLASPRPLPSAPTREGTTANVILSRTEWPPLDLGETPYFLGRVSAFLDSETGQLMSQETGFLPNKALDLGDWPRRLRFQDLPLADFVASHIPYGYNVLVLIDDPLVPIVVDGAPYLLVVTNANVDGEVGPDGSVSLTPRSISALLFSANAVPPAPPVAQNFGTYGGGVSLIGPSVPLDISETPILVASVGMEPQKSAAVTLREREPYPTLVDPSGASVTIALNEWYLRQPLNPTPPDESGATLPASIVDDIDFTLGGRHFALVPISAIVDTATGQGERLAGYIFRAR